MELECLIDFAGTAVWRRRKAEQYPEDPRNIVAAELLDRLGKGVSALEGSDLHMELEKAWLKSGEDEDEENWGPSSFGETTGAHLRSVGFGYAPDDTAAFVADLIDLVAPAS